MLFQTPVDCGNPELIQFQSAPARSVSKNWLGPITRDGKVFCAWCNQNELRKARSKYCSPACLETSSAYCYPQTNAQSFYFLFIKQEQKCADCKFDYGSTLSALKKEKLKLLKSRIQKKIESLKSMSLEQALGLKKSIKSEIKTFDRKLIAPHPFDMFTPKKIRKHHRKIKDQREPEVDHIVPIGAGGSALGFTNLQLLCYKCHKNKTAQDRALIRAFKQKSA